MKTSGLLLVMIFSLGFISSGCSVKAVAPGPILETPTVSQADFAFGMSLGGRPAQEVRVTPDYSARPVDLSKRWTSSVHDIYFGPNLGYRRFEVSLDLGVPVGTAFRLKYQVLGPALNEAKKGDWTATVGLQSIAGLRTESKAKATVASNEFEYKASALLVGTGFALSGGYFVSDNIQLFMGHTHVDYKLTYRIDQEPDGTNPKEVYEGEEDGWASTTGFGLQQVFGDNRTHAFHASLQY